MTLKNAPTRLVFSALALACAAVSPAAHAGSTSSKSIGGSTQVNLPVQPVVPIGVRIYIDPWNPLKPTQDTFKTYYDDTSIISRVITYAWERTRADMASELRAKLAEHDIGGGFRTYNANIVLPPISSFSIAPPVQGSGAVVKFTVPRISITTSFRTPTPAPSGLDPRFRVSADVSVSISLGFLGKGKALSSASVSAVVSSVNGPEGLDDSTKAIQIVIDSFSALSKFLIGADFKEILVGYLNLKDPAKQELQSIINNNLNAINDKLGGIPPEVDWAARKIWADHNRLTIYVATPAIPIPNDARTGWMKGLISWDANQVQGSCSGVSFAASVQNGPAPLERSDGATFGPAPVAKLAPSMSGGMQGPSGCRYTLSGLFPGLPNALFATTKLAAAKSYGSSSQYVGQLHTTTVIKADGWAGDYVTPNATDRNWIVTAGLTASGGVGKQVQKQMAGIPDPGVAEASPGASTQIGQFGTSTSTYQHSTQSAALANAAGATTTSSYNSAGSTGGSNAHGFTLQAGAYQFQYITSKGVTKTFHAKIVGSNGAISIHFGKKAFSGTIANNRFTSNETRANGKPALEGVLTANGAMNGRYIVETNDGKDYATNFTLAMQ